jgi:hypothetical protein
VAEGHRPSAGARKRGAKRPEFLVDIYPADIQTDRTELCIKLCPLNTFGASRQTKHRLSNPVKLSVFIKSIY